MNYVNIEENGVKDQSKNLYNDLKEKRNFNALDSFMSVMKKNGLVGIKIGLPNKTFGRLQNIHQKLAKNLKRERITKNEELEDLKFLVNEISLRTEKSFETLCSN